MMSSSYAASEITSKSSTPSILKKSSTLKRRSVQLQQRVVRFQLGNDVKSVLEDYRNDKGKEPYIEFVCHLRDAGLELKDEELLQLLKDARECMPMLDGSVKLFVQVLLLLKWAHRGEEVVRQYQNFVLDICSAYNYYTKFAMQQMVQQFYINSEDNEDVDSETGKRKGGNCYRLKNQLITDEEDSAFSNIHHVLRSLLKIVPMSAEFLLDAIKKKFPFKKNSLRYFSFIHNALIVTTYAPSLRREILSLILNKLIHLDVVTTKEAILEKEHEWEEESFTTPSGDDAQPLFEMDDEGTCDNNGDFAMEEVEEEVDMKHEDAKTLDLCLLKLYTYLHTECYTSNGAHQFRWDKAKILYSDLTSIFEDLMLTTHATTHVQFVYLYFVSFKRSLAENFVSFLWKKVINPNVPSVIRQAALCYLCGMVARAQYISVDMMKSVISNLAGWIQKYIDADSEQGVDRSGIRCAVHNVFYSACHSLFYIIAFRHRELFAGGKRGLRFIENLNLSRIISSKLNPLSNCSPTISEHFVCIMHTYQLTYCHPVWRSPSSVLNNPATNSTDMQRSSSSDFSASAELRIDEFFPFDIYLLRRSGKTIAPIFREYERLEQQDQDESMMMSLSSSEDEPADMISLQRQSHSIGSPMFTSSYNSPSSPGFY